MLTLGMDTSGDVLSVALFRGDQCVAQDSMIGKQIHSSNLLPMIARLLKQNQCEIQEITRYVVPKGPGSYTGIRIALAAAKGLALPRGDLCAGISTLTGMAYAIYDLPEVQALGYASLLCALDARRGTSYTAVFELAPGKAPVKITLDLFLSQKERERLCAEQTKPLVFFGDLTCFEDQNLTQALILPEAHRQKQAYGLVRAALEENYFVSPEALRADYIRVFSV